MKKKFAYKSPKISEKKIKLNFFLTYDFFDTLQNSLVSEVYASSHIREISDGNYNNNDPEVNELPDLCFPAGVKILMDDGSKKEIQEIKSGDTVASYNLSEGKTEGEKVRELIVRKNNDGYVLLNKHLKATPNHEIFVNMRLWLRADQVKVGDEFMDVDGKPVHVKSVEQAGGTGTVYNLSLNGKNHNYFAEGLLVHNQGCGGGGGY